jgi:hypothetical protein
MVFLRSSLGSLQFRRGLLSKTSKKRGTANQPKGLLQFFRESPLVGLELDFDRDRDEGRSLPREALTPRTQTRRARNGVPLLPVGPNTVPVTLDLVNRLRDELP